MWRLLPAALCVLLGLAAAAANLRDRGMGMDMDRDREEPRTLHIAGLFQDDEWQEIMAFRAAIERVNNDKKILPGITLEPVVEVLGNMDSFMASRRVCNLTYSGIAAIFGPKSRQTANIVSSIAETLEIPHIVTHPAMAKRPTNYQINVYPDRSSLSQAIVDLLEDMAWKTFTIVYEDDEGLFRLQEVLKAHSARDSPVTVRRLGPGPDYRQVHREAPRPNLCESSCCTRGPLLKEIQNSTETRIILDVSADKLIDIFHQAKQVKLMGDYVSYLVTSLDAHTLDFSELDVWAEEETGVSNITGFRLVDPSSMEVQNAVHDWIWTERLRGNTITLTPALVRTSSALVNDAVHMFARALHQLDQTEPYIVESPLSCEAADKWEHGERIVSFIKAKYSDPDNTERGMTGPLWLDKDADHMRTNFTLTLIETRADNATGTWNSSGIHLFRSVEEMERSTKELLSKKVMRVVSKLGAPYLMKKENWTEDMGNDGFRGYAIDLIDAIAKELHFKYEFYLVKDGKYGSLKDGRWDGIIKDLLDRKADLGICDLTITYDRERAVDFTMPFMNLGISILYSKAPPENPNLFSFLEPLSTEVWIYMASAFIGVSLLLFILARVTPLEWNNPHPCNPEPEELENTFTLINSMWFAMGSFLQQGCDFLPQAPSTRMVAGLWWFFTLIMISSYTANLAAFLTEAGLNKESINSAKDLAAQNKVLYGCLAGGSTQGFFANSNFSDYQRMWSIMTAARPSVFTKSNPEGVERVLNGKRDYAFFMESTSIEYECQRKCDLKMVGGHLDSKGYGIAMPRNSPYRAVISGAVLKLQESGKLVQLKELWWKQMDGGGTCGTGEDLPDSSDDNKLTMAHVGGVFLVLTYGCVGAIFVAVGEFLWSTRAVAIENKISPKEALMKEIRFAVRCSEDTKPVKHRTPTPSSSRSGSRSMGMGRSLARSLLNLNAFQRLGAGALGGEKKK
ncbi:Glutamate receptor ionotropic, kainate 2 [Frankliniella fusca]|uniref:Glutamate receptor ionotropic, kainate 2 n=1 Tax=Frankliniella fusca TaxID=407009 RepID=A0AAE1LHB7_9NEOP|nr:Glutamate receptor ionotropic, kainate 2 [Frankliniella fusca]